MTWRRPGNSRKPSSSGKNGDKWILFTGQARGIMLLIVGGCRLLEPNGRQRSTENWRVPCLTGRIPSYRLQVVSGVYTSHGDPSVSNQAEDRQLWCSLAA